MNNEMPEECTVYTVDLGNGDYLRMLTPPTECKYTTTRYIRADKAAPVGDVPHARLAAMTAFEILSPNMEAAINASEGTEADEMRDYWGYIGEYVRCPLLPLSQPKQSAPVERIELLENSLSWFDKFIAENGLDENGGLLRIRKAARAYLKLQGGD